MLPLAPLISPSASAGYILQLFVASSVVIEHLYHPFPTDSILASIGVFGKSLPIVPFTKSKNFPY